MSVGTDEMIGALKDVCGAVCARIGECGSLRNPRFCDGMIVAEAIGPSEPAEYRLFFEDGVLWVSWSTSDRWLSQSVEADLVFTGDDLDDMIDEELVDLGWNSGRLGPNEHFRSEDKRYTFRSRIPLDVSGVAQSGEALASCILAYDIVFAELGDMKGDDEDA